MMKRLLLFTLGFVGLFNFAKAQLIVSATEFARNPALYNGRTIILTGVEVNINNPANTANASIGSVATPVATLTGPVSVSPVAPTRPQIGGTTTPTGTTTAIQRCNPPKGWLITDVELPNNLQQCFVIYDKMATTLPTQKFNADLTLRVDTRLMHRITRVKVN
ncbi:MAG: hypothetical protein ACON5K_01945 [Bacteroidia bacterium]